ncbi:hypothetical protein KC799_02540 [candidate division KSB1 bacterium]|nr:hypothetical protein [candidate division KSB1 bacterium]
MKSTRTLRQSILYSIFLIATVVRLLQFEGDGYALTNCDSTIVRTYTEQIVSLPDVQWQFSKPDNAETIAVYSNLGYAPVECANTHVLLQSVNSRITAYYKHYLSSLCTVHRPPYFLPIRLTPALNESREAPLPG